MATSKNPTPVQLLADTISTDIVAKLKLPSGDVVNKLLLKELQSLTASNKTLAKTIENKPLDQIKRTTEEKQQVNVDVPRAFVSSPLEPDPFSAEKPILKSTSNESAKNIETEKLPEIIDSIKRLINKLDKKQETPSVVPKSTVETSENLPKILTSTLEFLLNKSAKASTEKEKQKTISTTERAFVKSSADVNSQKESSSFDFSKSLGDRYKPEESPSKNKEDKPDKLDKEDRKPDYQFPKILDSLKGVLNNAATPVEKEPKSELEKIEEPKPVKIVGFENKAVEDLKLPNILDSKGLIGGIKDAIKGAKIKAEVDGDSQGFLAKLIPPSLLPILGGSAAILAGLASLMAAFNTDGETKGLLSLIGKGGIKGGLAVMAKTLFKKFGIQVLKKIPIVGGLISFGLAIQRFFNGDIIGGSLELVSGLVGLIPIPGVGLALSTGIDILQGILDAQGGGSSGEASDRKGKILLSWAKKLGGYLWKGIKYVPVLGPALASAEAMIQGNVPEALKQLAYILPPLQILGILMGEEKATEAAGSVAKSVGGFLKKIGAWVSDKFTSVPVIGPLIKAVQNFSDGQWLKGFKQLAYIFTPFEMLGALFGDTETTPVVEAAATTSKGIFSKLGSWIAEKLGKIPFIGPVLRLATLIKEGNWGEALKSFPGGKLVASLFEAKEDDTKEKKEDTESGTSFLKGLMGWFAAKVDKLPLIGPIIKGIKLLNGQKYLEGLKQLAFAVPGIQTIFALFGDEDAQQNQQEQTEAIASFDWEGLKNFAQTRLRGLPVIGQGVKAIEAFSDNRWLEGIKHLAYMLPPLELLGALLGEKDVSETASTGANVLQGMAEWVGETLVKVPVIGPLIKAVNHFIDKEWIKGLKQIAYINPLFETLGAFLGDTETTPAVSQAAKKTTSMFNNLKEWFKQNAEKLPVIGPLVRAIKAFDNGEWVEGLKQMAYVFPPFEMIGALLGDKNTSDTTSSIASGALDIGSKITKFFKDLFNKILEGFVNKIPETVKVGYGIASVEFDVRRRVANWLGLDKENEKDVSPNKPSAAISSSKSESSEAPPPTPVKDALINPKGGLEVSSPLGARYQLDPTDGVLAAPMKDKESPMKDFVGDMMGSRKTDLILERIAINTATSNQNISNLITGFNNLAKALEKTLGKEVGIPPVVVNQNNMSNNPTSSQYGNQGNSDIAIFRTGLVEASRFRPA